MLSFIRPHIPPYAILGVCRFDNTHQDDFEKIELWGKHLTEELHRVYEYEAQLAVMFISKEYIEKAWPRHERQSMLSRAVREPGEYILPVRFDDTAVPGLQESVGYVQAKDHSPAELATMIAMKLGIKPFEGKASDVPPPRMTSLVGEVVFNYSNHNGLYILGRDTLEFETDWSKASNTSIHVYNDPSSINGIALGRTGWTNINQVTDAQTLDYTSRVRTPRIGQIVLFRNIHGFYAATQILNIKDDTRGDDHDELRFQYVIQPNGSDDFTALHDLD